MGNNVIEKVFAKDVFNDAVMAEKLPKKVYEQLKKTIQNGEDLDPSIAGIVAHAMKEWAMERGATHYTHWFQPMTGVTAEKHDSFISPTADGKVICEFSGKELIKGEADASSFPSGGMRATFEARGYTAWDCTSPAFLNEDAAGVILCIPTAFCSYTGEALDKKTPLLRSMEAISKEAVRICRLFGHDDVTRVTCSVGPEQEYFLIDREKYLQREDLVFTGRTLFGSMPPKGQELDDHYYGSIRERIASYMKELNEELWSVGVLSKTQHNEVAPAQHEMAPVYSTANIATDHNQLTMEIMKKVARRHGLECILHEKPFAGVNGSGKHNNWSLVTDTGINLLSPGKEPHENKLFLLVLAAIIKAVDENAGLLRLSASNPGNDLRLGADEAPPAIISVFLGEQLEDILAQLLSNGKAVSSILGERLNVGVNTIPSFRKDATDRNRTSPFAFTGNKFEFRSVASSMSIAGANTVLNTIVADQFRQIADELEAVEDKSKLESAIMDVIIRTVREHQRVIFNGDGYSPEWVREAGKRGLPNYRTMVDAVPELVTDRAIEMFERMHVYSRKELESRAEIDYESYCKVTNIEAKTMIAMASTQYIPAVIKYTGQLAGSINSIKTACPQADISVQEELLLTTGNLLSDANKALKVLKEADAKACKIDDIRIKANFFKNEVIPAMAKLRKPIDELEMIVDKKLWPVPTYADMLFEV